MSHIPTVLFFAFITSASFHAFAADPVRYPQLELKTNVSIVETVTVGSKRTVESSSDFDRIVLNRSKAENYTSMFEFFERRGKILGRFCMLTEAASFTDCITVVPKTDGSQTCEVRAYDPQKDVPEIKGQRDSSANQPGFKKKYIYQHTLDLAARESPTIARQLGLFNITKIGVPTDLRFQSMSVDFRQMAQLPPPKSPVEVVRMRGAGACEYYFNHVSEDHGRWVAEQKCPTCSPANSGAEQNAARRSGSTSSPGAQ